MTTISAKVVLDSVSEAGVRLTTIQLRYPSFLLAEVNTHKMLSRSSASLRARTTKSVLKEVEDDMVVPLHIGANQKGMQADTQVQGTARAAAIGIWREAVRKMVWAAREMAETCGVHKQVANRILAPALHTDTVLSGTDWENFFALRCHPDTEPHFNALAWLIADLYYGSTPTLVPTGGWHLPYVSAEERLTLDLETQKQCSAARCARVSYAPFDSDKADVAKDLDLHQKLVGREKDSMDPPHSSALEHPAQALAQPGFGPQTANFRGWEQLRRSLPNENMRFDYQKALSAGWRDRALSILG